MDTDVIDRDDYPAAHDGGYGADDGGGPPDADFAAIQALIASENIALDPDIVDEDTLGQIGDKVFREYTIDKQSRKAWEDRIDESMDIAMQVVKAKNYPWPNASNIKFPLITTAAMQFGARAYPAIVPGNNLVKGKVIGDDSGVTEDGRPGASVEEGEQVQWQVEPGAKRKRADRIGRHMSYQLTEEMEEWEEDTDTLLHMLPVVGCLFRKTWFDPVLGRNRSELNGPKEVVVHYRTKSLLTCPRITQEVTLYPHEIIERERMGLFRKIETGPPQPGENDDDEAGPDPEDDAAPHIFLEQHRKIDLDRDGYAEPYIVTVHRDTKQVVRIVANFRLEGVEVNEHRQVAKIKADEYFTKYGFIPAPDGGFYDVGFGLLLGPINDAVNTTLNQMMDAGHLQNAGGGFIGAGLRMKRGEVRFKPGEYKIVQAPGQGIAQNVVPLNFQGPSPVLFQLLGLLIEAAREVASIKDILLGESNGPNMTATTTLALIEQGMQVFSAIYKRIHRSLKSELRKLYRLNRLYLPPEVYYMVLDEPEAISQKDYEDKSLDVTPVSDPKTVSDMQKMARAEFLLGFKDDPRMNGPEIIRRVMEAASIEDADKLFNANPQPPPQLLEMADRLDLDTRKVEIMAGESEAKIVKMLAETTKLIAEAEATEAGPQIEVYKARLQALQELMKQKGQDDGQGRVRRMAQGFENDGGVSVSG